MGKLTKAQAWALQILADGKERSPSMLGQLMMERPGVIRRGGAQGSSQGHGRIGGMMGHRLVKMGLALPGRRVWADGTVESYGFYITPAGRRALAQEADHDAPQG